MLCPNRRCPTKLASAALVLSPILLAAVMPLASAEAGELIRLDDPSKFELQAVGFELSQGGTVHVEALGLRPRRADDLSVYGWILDAETRKPVWEMTRRKSKRKSGSRVLRTAEADIDLEAGEYELYLYAGSVWSGNWNWSVGDGVSGVLKRLFRDHDGDEDDDDDNRFGDYEDEYADCYIALSHAGTATARTFEVTGSFDDELVAFNKVGDSTYHSQGFEITQPMDFHIYSVFEFPKGDETPADYGWIMNVENRDVAWMPTKSNTRRAGGGSKNRVFDGTVSLQPGRYALKFGTDDSHSYESFNVRPPTDPVNWGITMRKGDNFSAGAYSTFDLADRGDVILAKTRVGDDEDIEQAFRLKRGGHLGVYALGEYSYDFYDYGWIADARTGRTVWEMTKRNTMPAGGAEKNRMFDGTVELDAGDYVLYYVTDGSHSFGDWNAATPFDAESWGVTLFATDDLSAADVELMDRAAIERSDGSILAKIVRVGEDERVRESFSLDTETVVHVYALGEGSGGDMYDYGYIVNKDTGRRVWRMRYRDTERAGGDSKNRRVETELELEPGTYEVVYVTDDSHSFGDWNARKPRDPENWGITVRRVE